MNFKDKFNYFIARRRTLNQTLSFLLADKAQTTLPNSEIKYFYIPKDNSGPSYHLIHRRGGFENYEHEDKKYIVMKMKANDCPVFVDVGANIGLISTYLSIYFPDAKIFSFEPDAKNFSCLSETISCNSCFQNIELFPLGLGEKSETKAIFRSTKNEGGHTFVKTSPDQIQTSDYIQIETLDNVLGGTISRLDFIKIDVEGFEESVLRGAEQLIEKHKPLMMLEIDHKHIINQTSVVEYLLKRWGKNLQFFNTRIKDGEFHNTTYSIDEIVPFAVEFANSGRVLDNYFVEFPLN